MFLSSSAGPGPGAAQGPQARWFAWNVREDNGRDETLNHRSRAVPWKMEAVLCQRTPSPLTSRPGHCAAPTRRGESGATPHRRRSPGGALCRGSQRRAGPGLAALGQRELWRQREGRRTPEYPVQSGRRSFTSRISVGAACRWAWNGGGAALL